MYDVDTITFESHDKKHTAEVPLCRPAEGRFRGFHKDDWLFFGYDEAGDLFMAHDTVGNKKLFPPKCLDTEARTGCYDGSTVYFIRAETGQIKIGLSKDPHIRLKKLQVGNPYILELVAEAEGGQKLERVYHKKFAAHRLNGEWFTPHPDILAEIDRLSPTQPNGACDE